MGLVSLYSSKIAAKAWKITILLAVTLVLLGVLGFGVMSSEARAACGVEYSSEELAVVQLINNYREAHGVAPLLVSDMLTQAADRHNSDMAKYDFVDHITGYDDGQPLPGTRSDWFATGATPWDRMAASGYGFNTSKGENLAAGIPYYSPELVFNGWKNSPGHNALMLDADFRVVGVSRLYVAGSVYGYYWTMDFGGAIDDTTHDPATLSGASEPTRYQQNHSYLAYTGLWRTCPSSNASGGSFYYTLGGGGKVMVKFRGTSISWLGKKGPVYGKARVYLDGVDQGYVDLYSATHSYEKLYTSETLADTTHILTIIPTNQKNPAALGTQVTVDAFDVMGTLLRAPQPLKLIRYQQTASRLLYTGTWRSCPSSHASGGSFYYTLRAGGKVMVKFRGTSIAWRGKKGPVYGKARVYLDGVYQGLVDLYSPLHSYGKLYGTETLANTTHILTIIPTNQKNPAALGTQVTVDAFDIVGTLLRLW